MRTGELKHDDALEGVGPGGSPDRRVVTTRPSFVGGLGTWAGARLAGAAPSRVARFLIEATDVRVERVQDGTQRDALAAGVLEEVGAP